MAITIARSLDTDRFHVRLFVHERWGDLLNSVDPKLDVIFQNEGHYNRRQLINSLVGNIRLARDCDVLVGANEGRASFFSIVAARLLRKPLVLCLQNNWGEYSKVVSWRQRISLRRYGAADAIVACSDGVADDFRVLVPSASNKIRTIYNSISVARVRAQSNVSLDHEHEAIFSQPVVITAGRLSYQKGQEFLIAAHAALRKQGGRHRLVILGQGELHKALADQATALGVSDSVYFLGFQDNPHRFIRRATVFALSSRFEGLPLIVAEALACGVPVVCTDCPSGPREMLDGGRFGVLVKTESAEDLAKGLATVLRDVNEQKRLASLASVRSGTFDVAHARAQWESMLVGLVNR